MNRTNLIVECGVLAVVVLALIYDAYVINMSTDLTTVSSAVLAAARRNPIIPFLTGLLFGHLLWSQ